MTPDQALKILDQAASMAQATRMDHIRIQEAIDVLKKLITSEVPDHG